MPILSRRVDQNRGAAQTQQAANIKARQFSGIQTQDNVGRQRIQYELADHKREFGFRDANIIDEGLGTSGDGIGRLGVQVPLEVVCKGKVGLVLSIKVSGLSRN